jgi:hypothetical protein
MSSLNKQPNRTSFIKQFTYNPIQNQTWTYLQSNSTTNINQVRTLTPLPINSNVYIGGNLTVEGTISNPSDRDLKKDLEDLSLSPNINDQLMKLRPKKYVYKDDKENKLHFGLVAQDVEEYFPNLVNETVTTKTTTTEQTNPAYKTVNYLEIIPLLLLKIQDLQNQINQINNTNTKEAISYQN